ncbi:MAG: DUF3467 domain-containing protein [Candidatus Aminicenantia bacterium]
MEKKIEMKIDESIATGQYSNIAAIRHSREEFIFDFAFVFPDAPPDNPQGKLIARIILSPAHAKRFFLALEDNIRKYEKDFGNIPIPEIPSLPGLH